MVTVGRWNNLPTESTGLERRVAGNVIWEGRSYSLLQSSADKRNHNDCGKGTSNRWRQFRRSVPEEKLRSASAGDPRVCGGRPARGSIATHCPSSGTMEFRRSSNRRPQLHLRTRPWGWREQAYIGREIRVHPLGRTRSV